MTSEKAIGTKRQASLPMGLLLSFLIALQAPSSSLAQSDDSLRMKRPTSGSAAYQPAPLAVPDSQTPDGSSSSSSNNYMPPSAPPRMYGSQPNTPLSGGVQTFGSGTNLGAQSGTFQGGAGMQGTFQSGVGMQAGSASDGSHILQGGVRRLDSGTSDQGNVPLQGQTGTVDHNQPPPLDGHVPTNVLTGGLTQVELKRLYDHDIVLLIDKSGSMGSRDCPMPKGSAIKSIFTMVLAGPAAAGCSRWDWCGIEAANLGKVTAAGSPQGLSVVLFESMFRIYAHVPWEDIPKIFRQNGPGGGTNLAAPLNAVFKDYFDRRNMGRTKPLAIGIITDGCPDDKRLIIDEIIAASRATRYPKEISITFFLIGSHDPAGERFVWDLDQNLPSFGATYDIVNAVPFYRLTQEGLPKALADTLE